MVPAVIGNGICGIKHGCLTVAYTVLVGSIPTPAIQVPLEGPHDPCIPGRSRGRRRFAVRGRGRGGSLVVPHVVHECASAIVRSAITVVGSLALMPIRVSAAHALWWGAYDVVGYFGVTFRASPERAFALRDITRYA